MCFKDHSITLEQQSQNFGLKQVMIKTKASYVVIVHRLQNMLTRTVLELYVLRYDKSCIKRIQNPTKSTP